MGKLNFRSWQEEDVLVVFAALGVIAGPIIGFVFGVILLPPNLRFKADDIWPFIIAIFGIPIGLVSGLEAGHQTVILLKREKPKLFRITEDTSDISSSICEGQSQDAPSTVTPLFFPRVDTLNGPPSSETLA